MAFEQKYASIFLSEANSCEPVIAAPVATTAVLFGNPSPAIKLMLELTATWMNSAGGENGSAP